MALINHVEWTKTCALCKDEFPQMRHMGLALNVYRIYSISVKTVKEVMNDKAHGTYIVRNKAVK